MRRILLFFMSLVICISLISCTNKRENKNGDLTTKSSATTTMSTTSAKNTSITIISSNTDAATNATIIKTPTPKTIRQSKSAKRNTTTSSSISNTVMVMMPEGYSVSQIGEKLEKNGVCKKVEFLKAINEYPFNLIRYPLVKAIPNFKSRCYRLEGYLYPNTYEFYINMKPQDAIGIMLRGAESRIGNRYKYSEMSTDEIITLASIIEREAARLQDMMMVSSVLHNRLAISMRLQADSTITYIESFVKPNLPKSQKDRYNSIYNTYKCKGLPEGPICNPGKNALFAAANPDDTDYLYFVSDKNGKFYYAKSYEEHETNLIKAGIKKEK